jgi:hypothetical protein
LLCVPTSIFNFEQKNVTQKNLVIEKKE